MEGWMNESYPGPTRGSYRPQLWSVQPHHQCPNHCALLPLPGMPRGASDGADIHRAMCKSETTPGPEPRLAGAWTWTRDQGMFAE